MRINHLTGPARFQFSRAIIFFVIAIAISSCAHVSAPDDNISKDAIDIYSKTLAAMDDAEVKPFSQSKRPLFYRQVQDQIQVLELRAEAAGSASDRAVVQMAGKLSDAFENMKKDDESGWGINKKGKEFEIQQDLDAIRSNILTILRQQSAIKGLASVGGSSTSKTPGN
jgi:hypothetical protein